MFVYIYYRLFRLWLWLQGHRFADRPYTLAQWNLEQREKYPNLEQFIKRGVWLAAVMILLVLHALLTAWLLCLIAGPKEVYHG